MQSSKIRMDVIPVENHVAVTLYYLKDQRSMRMTTNSFGITRNTVGEIICKICLILTHNE